MMRIACPNCAAEYDVPDTALAGGPRRLRCARCGHMFTAELPAPPAEPSPPAPAPPAGAEPPDLAADAPPPDPPGRAEWPDLAGAAAPQEGAGGDSPQRPPPARGPIRLSPIEPPLPPARDLPDAPPDRIALIGWVVTVLLLIAAVVVAYLWRFEIMAVWPPAARLFGALDLD